MLVQLEGAEGRPVAQLGGTLSTGKCHAHLGERMTS